MADRHIYVYFANAQPGREDEFNDWYNNRHLPELLRIPGYLSARRFEISEHQKQPTIPATHRYLALYELEGDPQRINEATVAARNASLLTPTTSLAPEHHGWLYSAITPVIESQR